MSVIMDYIISGVLFGVLTLTIARVQGNLNSSVYQNTYSFQVQTNAAALGMQIEHDFLKMGYHVSGQKITYADSVKITFLSDMDNDTLTPHTLNTVTYQAGNTSQAAFTSNPRDFPLFRTMDGAQVKQNWGLISFYFAYFDSTGTQLWGPITSSSVLNAIKGIDVKIRVESSDSVYADQGYQWPAVSWEKFLLPRNLRNLNY